MSAIFPQAQVSGSSGLQKDSMPSIHQQDSLQVLPVVFKDFLNTKLSQLSVLSRF